MPPNPTGLQSVCLSSDHGADASPCLWLLLARCRVVVPNAKTGCGWVVQGIDTLLLPMPGDGGINPLYVTRGPNSSG